MSWLSDFMHPGRPYQDAQNEANRGYNEGQGYYKPYAQHGQESGDMLAKMMQMLSNPQQMQKEWASSYEKSPYATQLQNEAQGAGMDAASQMGLQGSSGALSNIQKGASNIMQGDRQNYFNDLMQKLNAGIGVGQNMYGIGANAAGQMGQNAISHGNDMAGLKFGEKSAGANRLSTLGSGALQMLMQYLTGGAGGQGASA